MYIITNATDVNFQCHREGDAGSSHGRGLGGSGHSVLSAPRQRNGQLVRHLPAVQLLLRTHLRIVGGLLRCHHRPLNASHPLHHSNISMLKAPTR